MFIETKEQLLRDLDTFEARLASLVSSLQGRLAALRGNLPKCETAIEEVYYVHFTNAFIRAEDAKRDVRAMDVICHQADHLETEAEKARKKGRR
jgi:hypothetical protein